MSRILTLGLECYVNVELTEEQYKRLEVVSNGKNDFTSIWEAVDNQIVSKLGKDANFEYAECFWVQDNKTEKTIFEC